jgi:acyl carrier protein
MASAIVTLALATDLGCSRTEHHDSAVSNAADARPSNPSNESVDEIRSKIRRIIAEQLGVAEDSFSLSDSLMSKLGADELDIVELVMEIEDVFRITIPDDAIVDPVAEVSTGIPAGFSGNDLVRIVTSLQTGTE